MGNLKRQLSFFDVLVYGVGLILGAGIYAIIGEATALTGTSVWIAFVLAAFIAMFTGFSYAELASFLPQTSAASHYVQTAFKNRFLSFTVGWLMLIMGIATAATVSLAFASYLLHIFVGNNVTQTIFSFASINLSLISFVSILLLIVLSYVSFKGLKDATFINTVCTFIETSGLILIILIGAIVVFGKGLPHIDFVAMPNGVSGLLSAATLIFFAYVGFEQIANLSEEVENPEKKIPLALLGALGISTLLYVLVALSSVIVVPWHVLGQSSAPLATVAQQVLGADAGTTLSIIALFSTGNTVLISLMITARILYGMSKQGLFPKIFTRIDPRNSTPNVAIVVVLIVASLFSMLKSIGTVAAISNFAIFLVFFFVNLAAIKLRYTYKEKRPFRMPLNIGNFPLLAFGGVLTCALALLNYVMKINNGVIEFVFSSQSFVISMVVILIGAGLFILFGLFSMSKYEYFEKFNTLMSRGRLEK